MTEQEMIKKVKDSLKNTQMVVSWYAEKYGKTIFRPANMDKAGCRVWENANGDKYICFWDMLRDRYTTAKNPQIAYRSIQ